MTSQYSSLLFLDCQDLSFYFIYQYAWVSSSSRILPRSETPVSHSLITTSYLSGYFITIQCFLLPVSPSSLDPINQSFSWYCLQLYFPSGILAFLTLKAPALPPSNYSCTAESCWREFMSLRGSPTIAGFLMLLCCSSVCSKSIPSSISIASIFRSFKCTVSSVFLT